jgi:WD40 repeat protein
MKGTAPEESQIEGLRLAAVLREKEPGCVTRLAWSPTGDLLAVPTQNGDVEFWDTQKLRMQSHIQAHGGTWTTSVAWSPDGKHVAAGSGDGKTRIWRTLNAERQLSPSGSTLALPGNYVAWSPDGNLLATALLGESCSV